MRSGRPNATTYKYNGFGQKVNETNATGFNAYALIWDGDDYLGDVVDGADGPVFANLLRTVDGVMLGHVQDFMVDFLGSITGTTNVTTGAIVNTYRYKPYGAKLSGGTIGLGFFWTGNTGSRSTGRQFAEQYNRARHYSSVTGQWTTRDRLWPRLSAYGYVLANPVAWVDPSGLQRQNPFLPKPKPKPKPSPPRLPWPFDPGSPVPPMYPVEILNSDIMELVNQLCGEENIGGCKGVNDVLPPCTGGTKWEQCGQLILADSSAFANQSHWPSPRWQTVFNNDWGASLCCVECQMRVCCAFGVMVVQKWS
jgi:RHS repeat-associated protein